MKKLFKHNPAFFSDEELRSRFVVRRRELDTLLRCVRENSGSSNQHVLVIGPRGMGKTMLVRRLAQAVRDDLDIGEAWIPLVLPEECYSVATAGELWLQVVKQIAESPGTGTRWQEIYQSLHDEPEEYLRERALARLMEFSDEQDRRLLIIVENLNMLLGEQAADNVGWNLRHTLLNEPRLMIMATATTRFDEIANADKPFYEAFRELTLQPLPVDESIRLWEEMAGERFSEDQIEPLSILTGGNPRMLALMGDFAMGKSFIELMDNLIYLIDDHTAYFKANVENLAAVERRVFVALAEIWQPAGAREVARQSRLDVNKASALLKRLTSRGAVSEVGREGRKKLYQVSERLFNIYHLLRRSRNESDRVRVLVRFMAMLFDPVDLGHWLSMEAIKADAGKRWRLITSYEQLLIQTDQYQMGKFFDVTPGEFINLPEMAADVRAKYVNRRTEKFAHRLGILSGKIGNVLDEGDPVEIEKLLLGFEELIKDIEMPNTDGLEAEHRSALLSQGYLLSSLDQTERAVEVLDRALKEYADPKEGEAVYWYVHACGLRGQYLAECGRHEKAISSFDAIIEQFAGIEHPMIAERVALAFVHKGDLLRNDGNFSGALMTFDRMLETYRSRQDACFRKHLCLAMYNRGLIFDEMKQWENAIEAYGEAINRFGVNPEPEIAPGVVWSFVYKGYALGQLNRHEEAVELFRSVITEFDDTNDDRLTEPLASAMQNLSAALGRLERLEESLEVSERLAQQLVDRDEPQLKSFRAGALHNMGNAYNRLGNIEQALTAFEESIEKYSDLPESTAERPVSWALNGGAWVICESMLLDRLPQGLEWSEKVVERFPEDALFLHTRACLLGLANRWPQAFDVASSFLEKADLSGPRSVGNWIEDITIFFIDAAAAGKAAEALAVLERSQASSYVEPLVVALRRMVGVEYKAPEEVVKVSDSVLKRIQQRRDEVFKQGA